MAAGVGGSSGWVAGVPGMLDVLGVALVSLRQSVVGVLGRSDGSGRKVAKPNILGAICTTLARPSIQPGTSSKLLT